MLAGMGPDLNSRYQALAWRMRQPAVLPGQAMPLMVCTCLTSAACFHPGGMGMHGPHPHPRLQIREQLPAAGSLLWDMKAVARLTPVACPIPGSSNAPGKHHHLHPQCQTGAHCLAVGALLLDRSQAADLLSQCTAHFTLRSIIVQNAPAQSISHSSFPSFCCI